MRVCVCVCVCVIICKCVCLYISLLLHIAHIPFQGMYVCPDHFQQCLSVGMHAYVCTQSHLFVCWSFSICVRIAALTYGCHTTTHTRTHKYKHRRVAWTTEHTNITYTHTHIIHAHKHTNTHTTHHTHHSHTRTVRFCGQKEAAVALPSYHASWRASPPFSVLVPPHDNLFPSLCYGQVSHTYTYMCNV